MYHSGLVFLVAAQIEDKMAGFEIHGNSSDLWRRNVLIENSGNVAKSHNMNDEMFIHNIHTDSTVYDTIK